MRLRLTPQKPIFFDMFERSAAHLVTGAGLLRDMLGDGADRKEIARRMRELEHEADEVAHAVYREVNSTFVTPFDREDIHRLAHSLDEVMDAMEATVDLIWLYQIDAYPGEITDQVKLLEQAAELTAAAMPRLRSMKNLQEYFIEANRLENEADKVYRRLLVRLFSGEYPALTVMKLKDIVDELEEAADAFEDVAHTAESISVKES
jgi:predicted phosphate transport protein (TIGR00153 family)